MYANEGVIRRERNSNEYVVNNNGEHNVMIHLCRKCSDGITKDM